MLRFLLKKRHPLDGNMKTHQFTLPDVREIEVFFDQMRQGAPNQETIEPCSNTERNPKRVEIVVDNNSRNPGIVQKIYGKLE